MEDLFSYRLSLLQKEMEMLQNGIRGYDSIVFTIKGWAITVFSAIILFAVDKQRPFLYLFCIASVLSFWLIDSYYKSTQNILISRYRKIECSSCERGGTRDTCQSGIKALKNKDLTPGVDVAERPGLHN